MLWRIWQKDLSDLSWLLEIVLHIPSKAWATIRGREGEEGAGEEEREGEEEGDGEVEGEGDVVGEEGGEREEVEDEDGEKRKKL